MSKKAEPKFITDFIEAVYPEYPDLCVAFAHTEEVLLTDATKRIRDLESALALEQRKLQVSRKVLDGVMFTVGLADNLRKEYIEEYDRLLAEAH